jgi:methyl-accepting chemotaxis protein
VALFAEFVDAARSREGAIVGYRWPKPGSEEPAPKLAYVKGFEPWGWAIGTGIYVDDVDEVFAQVALGKAMQGILLLAVLLGVAYAIQRSISVPITRANQAMMRIASGDGDLTQRLHVDGEDEIAALARSFNEYTSKIQAIVGSVHDMADQLAAAAEELSVTARSNSETTASQKSETQQVATAMTEMAATVTDIAGSAEDAAGAAREAHAHSLAGHTKVGQVVGEMNELAASMQETADVVAELNAKSEAIGGILDVIRGIAEQTNLLALNAAIEAARAGEQGRGFAVVADEVRTLASRTQESTHQIQAMIEQLQSGSGSAVSAIGRSQQSTTTVMAGAQEANGSLDEIVHAIGTIIDKSAQVANAAEEQAVATQEIDRSIVAIASMATQSAENTQESAAAAASLAELSEGLRDLVRRCKTS